MRTPFRPSFRTFSRDAPEIESDALANPLNNVMNAKVETSLSERIEFDFSRLKASCDEIFQRVDAQFARLTSDGDFEVLQSFAARSFAVSPQPLEKSESRSLSHVPFEARLGSVSMTRQEASSLELNQIIPLTESVKGRVQIWSNGRRCAEGTLFVANGKLIVKILSVDSIKESDDE